MSKIQSIKKMLGLGPKAKNLKIVYIPVPQCTAKQTKKVIKTLGQLNKTNCSAIYVGINSGSKDSLVQAEIMGSHLQRKAKDIDVPLVTHAEDSAFGSAFHLLMHGDTVLSDKATFVGGIGYRMTPWMLKDFVEKYEIKVKYVHHGENKVRFNRFQELKERDVEWILKILNKRKDNMLEYAFERRGDKLSQEGKDILSTGDSAVGKDAEVMGIIDQAIQPDVYFHEKMPENHIGLVKPSLKEKLGLASTYSDYNLMDELMDEKLNLEERDMIEFAEEMCMKYFFENNLKCQHFDDFV